jgi:hypothetical protein
VRFHFVFLGALGGIVACGGSTSDDVSGTGGGGTSSGGFTSSGGNVSSGGSTACSKLCNGVCVSVDDPQTGCATSSCEPCNVPHATPMCTSTGECDVGSCDPGYANCDIGEFTAALTGCESNIAFDPMNCGSCAAQCTAEPGSEAVCVDGKCGGSTCPFGFGTCGAGECKTPLNTPQHCGSCAKQCSSVNGSASCLPTPGATYVCTTDCNDGFADCDGIEQNGCETNVQNDVDNCGACNSLCKGGPHSTAVCASDECKLVCDAGWSNCNASIADGCETQGSLCK